VVLTVPVNRKPTLRSVADWYATDGVLDVVTHGEQVTIRVTRDRSDALLLTALRDGWSVETVSHSITVKGNAR
jgi:hypothetical protein